MKDSKLIALIDALDVPSRIRLKKWVHSPAHNHREDVKTLFDYLYELKDYSNGHLGKEDVYAAIYSDQDYNDKDMRHLMSYLHRVIDDFLIYEQVQNRPATAKLHLIQAYDDLNLKKHFDGELKKVSKMQEKSDLRDDEYHFRNYRAFKSEYNSFEGKADAIKPETLQGISDELDLYYISNKLRNACNILTHKKLYKVEYQPALLEQIIRHVEEKELVNVPAVGTYYHLYKILKEEDAENNFNKLVAMIGELKGKFSLEETRGLFLLAINYGIRQINSGRTEYIRKVFDLYRKGLQESVLLVDGFLSPYTYTNIAATALKLDEFDWVDSFIKDHLQELPEGYRDSFFEYNLAKLHFAKRDFARVTKILNTLIMRDTFLSLESKVTMIKSYYELGEFELIQYQLDNFRQVLRRREVLTYHRTIFKNFVGFMKKLISLPPGNEKAREKLKDEIAGAELTIDKDWLIAKVEAA